MSELQTEVSVRKIFGTELREVIHGDTPLDGLLTECARLAVRAHYLDPVQKKTAINVGRRWAQYAGENHVSSKDVFAIRGHVANFAGAEVPCRADEIRLKEADICEIITNGASYEEVVAPYVSTDFLKDNEIAVYGGTARIALKMLAGVDVAAELPLHDVDAIIPSHIDIAAKAAQYGVDLTGAKVIDGNIDERLAGILSHTDCTMNQVAIYNGKLIYSEQALDDIRAGVIRITPKDDPLFGKEGLRQPNGLTYLDKKGLYRGLSFLLRRKGTQFVLSEENLEREKGTIERYWLIMLLVKLMPMKDERARYDAVGHWHSVANRIGCTETHTPAEFYRELISLYPETRVTNQAGGEADMNSQVRWIIEKLADRVVDIACGCKEVILPEECTPMAIELSNSFEDYDMGELLSLIEASRPTAILAD